MGSYIINVFNKNNMKKRYKIIIGIIISLIVLPIILIVIFLFFIPKYDWGVTEKLGNNYELVVMGRNYYPILYRKKNEYSSHYIVNEDIIEYNYNDRWILAKSSRQNYWIIDKAVPINLDDTINVYRNVKAGLIGPLDSLSFYKTLADKNIDLKLRKRKN